jgi:hypothetical protein
VPSYEPEVIERFAAQLERRARAVRRGFTLCGLALGALFGSFPLTSYGSAWPIPHILGFTTLVLGAGVGALIGWVVGEGRAAMYRLHAQTTLCQLHAQRTTLAIWRLLQERPDTHRVAEFTRDLELEPEAEREPEPEPEPEPVLAPAARLAAPPPLRPAPLRVEPTRIAEPVQVRPPAPEPLPAPPPTPAREPFVPVSAAPPAYEPAPAVAVRATPASLRPAGTPAPPVQPPPLSG